MVPRALIDSLCSVWCGCVAVDVAGVARRALLGARLRLRAGRFGRPGRSRRADRSGRELRADRLRRHRADYLPPSGAARASKRRSPALGESWRASHNSSRLRRSRAIPCGPGRHTQDLTTPLGRRHPPGRARLPPSLCSASRALWRVRENTLPRALRSQALRTIAPKSLRMMVWGFWAADARSERAAWMRRTAALLPRPQCGQQRCVEGGSSREVVLQRVRPAARRAH